MWMTSAKIGDHLFLFQTPYAQRERSTPMAPWTIASETTSDSANPKTESPECNNAAQIKNTDSKTRRMSIVLINRVLLLLDKPFAIN